MKDKACGPFPTKEMYIAVADYAAKQGVNVYTGTLTGEDFKGYPWLLLREDEKRIVGFTGEFRSGQEDKEEVTINAFLNRIEQISGSKLRITPDYEAILEDDGIHVGCQVITYAKFNELATMVNSRKK